MTERKSKNIKPRSKNITGKKKKTSGRRSKHPSGSMHRVWRYLITGLAIVMLGWLAWGCFGPKTSRGKVIPFEPKHYQLEGAIYTGRLSHGKPDGPGVMQLSDGSVMAGTWNRGLREGVFRYSSAEHVTTFALWKGDKAVEAVEPLRDQGALYGVDISHYQNEAWGAMMICVDDKGKPIRKKDSDVNAWRSVDFVIIKATEGSDMRDSRYAYHSEMADILDIPQGAYHVFSSKGDVIAQVDNYMNVINGVHQDFPAVLDIEGSSREIPQSLFSEQEDSYVLWLETIAQRTGRKPMIYCCHDFYKHYGRNTKLSAYDFWIADYNEKAQMNDCHLRQITDKGCMSGWAQYVDVDVLTSVKP